MSDKFLNIVVDPTPLSYETPRFPALYWPIPINGPQNIYLYGAHDIWLFTLYWTLIIIVAVHLVAAACAVVVQYRNWKLTWVIPIVYVIIGGTEALIAGNAVGGLLGAVYSAGHLKMSTWIPLSWGLINALILILSSFAIQGGL